jgi:hypothetical protein
VTNALGVDMSVWQATTPSLDGQAFAFVRAAYGDAKDNRWDQHSGNVRKAGLFLGAYLFARDQSPADQVRTFLATAPDADMWAVDYERDRTHPTDVTHPQMREIMRRIQSTGRKVGAYATPGTMHDWGQDWTWYADPGPVDAPASWSFRQRRSGVPKGNEYNGTEADLGVFLGMANLTVTSDVPHDIHIHPGSPIYDMTGRKIDTQTASADRRSGFRAHVGSGGPVYWQTTAPVSGDTLAVLVGNADVDDKGPITPGASAADLAAAKAAGFAEAKAKAIAAVSGI